MKEAEKHDKPFLIEGQPGETEEQAIARTVLSPALQSAWTLKEYVNSPIELDLQALIDCLEKQVGLVKKGNLDSIEQMLLVQAFTLDAIANNLFRRSKNQEYLKQLETYMKLGLRAQCQSRAVLEALINMKSPKTALNQTNIGFNQQVNNEIAQSKLVEEKCREKWLEQGTSAESIGANVETDPHMEAMGTQHRAAKP